MIQSFKHKGLERFFTADDARGVPAHHADRIRRILDVLHNATAPRQLDIPGLKFHSLEGPRKGTFSVWVSGNWRITFRFAGDHATAINLEDYH